MEGRCKTCHWWGRYRADCCERVDNDDPADYKFEIEVHVLDDTGLSAYLKTGPEFGCVYWERGK